jgi:hypothetical protein
MPNYSLVHLLRFANIRTFDFGSKAALSPTDVTPSVVEQNMSEYAGVTVPPLANQLGKTGRG